VQIILLFSHVETECCNFGFQFINDGFYAGKYLEGKAMMPPFFIQVKCSSYVVSEWRPRL